MKKILGLCAILTTGTLFAQNNFPIVSNLSANVDTAQKEVTISFNVSDVENDSLEISLAVSDNNGQTYLVNVTGTSGDIGFPEMPGNGKQVIWDYSSLSGLSGSYRLKIVANDRHTVSIQSIVDQVDSLRLINDMDIVEGTRNYGIGLAHLEEVKDTIFGRFNAAGLNPYRQEFVYGATNAENIIGKKAGLVSEGTVYIVDGHFDCVTNGPGADDNGSAVIGVLEAARILSQHDFKKTIRFIGFDIEELGLRGSQAYVADGILPGENIGGVLNFEMIGYFTNRKNTQNFPNGFNQLFPAAYAAVASDTFRGNFITNVADGQSSTLKQKFDDCAAAYVPGLRVISFVSPGFVPDLRRSDHAPFWDAGMPALMLTDGAEFRNPNYHTATDVSDSLDFGFIQKVVKATVATLAELAEPIHAGSEITDVQLPNVPAGINEFNQADKLSISPNPGDDKIYVTWSAINAYNQITLIDMKGNTVYNANISSNGNQHVLLTDLLANGVYIVKVSGKGVELTERIIVKH